MPESKPPTAFIAAGVVLVAMPLLIAFGIAVVGVTAGFPDSDPQISGVMLTGFVVWVLFVFVIVTVFVIRLLRRRHDLRSDD